MMYNSCQTEPCLSGRVAYTFHMARSKESPKDPRSEHLLAHDSPSKYHRPTYKSVLCLFIIWPTDPQHALGEALICQRAVNEWSNIISDFSFPLYSKPKTHPEKIFGTTVPSDMPIFAITDIDLSSNTLLNASHTSFALVHSFLSCHLATFSCACYHSHFFPADTFLICIINNSTFSVHHSLPFLICLHPICMPCPSPTHLSTVSSM